MKQYTTIFFVAVALLAGVSMHVFAGQWLRDMSCRMAHIGGSFKQARRDWLRRTYHRRDSMRTRLIDTSVASFALAGSMAAVSSTLNFFSHHHSVESVHVCKAVIDDCGRFSIAGTLLAAGAIVPLTFPFATMGVAGCCAGAVLYHEYQHAQVQKTAQEVATPEVVIPSNR